ncbi:hypothetical protein KKC08_04395 [Patescibacteria group bacterium]|nr:hypothetical protein [Patescibacteria group bacterium]MCG2702417.1 hypothetical protein [Candidatus Parcubacteria bacterium]MBU4264533.1 hypothetical protein [Patescibacteria group bacterium]MBU4390464.1 hypothetical protein [Patescibacteria group bacterium]MBU4397380.1 hypothetical protein [Patescibacteria group bacterium]
MFRNDYKLGRDRVSRVRTETGFPVRDKLMARHGMNDWAEADVRLKTEYHAELGSPTMTRVAIETNPTEFTGRRGAILLAKSYKKIVQRSSVGDNVEYFTRKRERVRVKRGTARKQNPYAR